MYQDLKRDFWWPNMKTEIAEFVSRCIVCQQVKIEHQKHLDYYNLWRFLRGSGNTSPWILLADYPVLERDTIQCG
ncbi:DNA/RNA polymerases superfamily protein [Trifolium medium]|uniref:DNA/RNA polymerases superfamily protein n=1 Tax=Trifolium medium TaxID=97028 RepID=A0A392U518_9FABA|nr:DNA/RNA polymerases superfamily protein [Trifolium medium]